VPRRRCSPALRSLAIATLLVCALSRAATSDPGDPDATGSGSATPPTDTAESLFNEGRTFAAAGNYVAACERFERALALDTTALGTALNLADCYQKRALTAKAYHLFARIARDADLAHDDAKQIYAHDRAAQLVAQLVDVELHVASPAHLAIAIDGVPVEGVIGATVHEVADPGTVVIDATAPGLPPFHAERRAGAKQTLAVDVVLALPDNDHIEPFPPGAGVATRRTSWVIASVAAGGAGVIAAGLGLGFGDAARADHDRVLDDGSCRATPRGLACTPAGATAEAHAGHLADLATGLTIGGAVLVAGAAVVWLVAPRDHVHGYAIAPAITPSEIGVLLDRAF
jgi:hypothetical protein